MAVEPIQARCGNCRGELLLRDVVAGTSGRCPGCGELLAPGYTFLLLEEARKAETLQRALVMCLQRLVGLPGHLELAPDSVFRNAVAAVDWDERLADDREIIRAEAAQMRPQVRAWRRLARRDRERAGGSLVASIRRLAQRLQRHGDLLEQRNVELADRQPPLDPTPVRSAAGRMDAAAEAVAGDHRLADDIVREALDTADASLEGDTASTA
ncbi:MAG: hypothetical protein M3N52_04975 [Actinomycetota bacterium]|nr:hypothetical protein [Actinomycetota bacterium]